MNNRYTITYYTCVHIYTPIYIHFTSFSIEIKYDMLLLFF